MSAVISAKPNIYEDICSWCLDEEDKYKTAQVNGRWSFVSGVDSEDQLLIDNEIASRFILKKCCHAIHKKCFDSNKLKSCPVCRISWVPANRIPPPAIHDIEANRVLATPEERQNNIEELGCCFSICVCVAAGVVLFFMINFWIEIQTSQPD